MRWIATTSVALALCLLQALWLPAAYAQDADKDGLPDAIEEQLGTDKGFAEKLETVGKFDATLEDRAELDVVQVDLAPAAKERWLWAIRFAKPYTFDNSSLILYLDSDNDSKTGRTGMGCEAMLAHSEGTPGCTGFLPDGTNGPAPPLRVALADGVLYLCHDGPLKQVGGRSVFRYTVLSETREPHVSMDSTGWVDARGPGASERKRPASLEDAMSDEGFERTEGLDLIRKLQADPANVVLSPVTAELRGMAYYDAEYRWPAVRGANGSITVAVPRGGRFYPGVVVYDAGGREAYELQVDGKVLGRFVAAEDDRRQRVYFLSRPVDFRGGEKLTIRTGSAGAHITEDILLLAQKPPVRGRRFEVRQVEAGVVMLDGRPQARLTWITTWPSACTVEYGTTPKYGRKLAEKQAVANHRLYLPGLRPGATYHFRVVAPRPDGKAVAGKDAVFTFALPKPFAGKVKRARTTLKVENPYESALAGCPVTSGVPFAKGELGDTRHVRLVDAAGKEVLLQAKVSARWQDGSIKWLLLSFPADVAAKRTATYALEYGSAAKRAPAASPLKCFREGDRIVVQTGPLRAELDPKQSGFPFGVWFDANGDGEFLEDEDLGGERHMGVEVRDTKGLFYTTNNPPESIEVEEAGPVRVVVKVRGHHLSEGQEPFFAYTNRFIFTAGSPTMRVQYTWGNDVPAEGFARFKSIALHVPLLGPQGWSWRVGLGGGEDAVGQGSLALRQMRDDRFTIEPAPAAGASGERAEGWVDLSNGEWGVTAAVRDFWQLYPKALRMGAEGLEIDLCPDFAEGTYDDCSKLDEIKLYHYLMGGHYRVRRGLQKQHEILFAFHQAGAGPAEARLVSEAFQEPLIAVCPPARYCGSGVFGEILPATAGRSADYEDVCEKVYEGYLRHREGSHEYGMLHFGDQFGERKVNWANGEYDHHHAFLMQFIRTGDRRWYFLGDRAARHAIDVDTCHDGPHAGGFWTHAMGHTGGYFSQPYEGNGIPQGYLSPSHTWTEGFCDWYFLSGDPTAMENAALVADYYDGAYLNNYDFSNCRDNGWHLLLTLAAYRATDDPYYLNAARIIVERTLERQTPGGGWHRQMVPGHCHCMPRHRGEANFMLGVLANGLEEYYREVPDPRVAQAVIGGAKQAVAELWVPESDGFRYTSCPKMTGYTANNDMTAEVLFFAHHLGGDRQYGEIAMRAMRAAFKDGIGSIAHLRWTPHILYNMDLLRKSTGQ